ncbi:hypothetical protein G7Y89_g8386 [Cudoniella acicularis]|uniref:Zn(2)-C6 fungal-type domain-containing protein n=1 Tax=Cudoniella acicularis TaxID=354080 RepID=A0A8H4W2X3_9HELO|nr:hypothetical protein G7Y89_g8386 [Cudoniella acicularis]
MRNLQCDEAKPNCNRCTSTRRKCDGYTDEPIPRTSRQLVPSQIVGTRRRPSPGIAPRNQITLPTFDDSQQLHFFEFFISCTCTVSPTYFGADFWSHRVLQLSLSEPAIRYALCSLSSLHRLVKEADTGARPDILTQYETFSLQQYTLAVSHTQKLLVRSSTGEEEAIIKGLVACILFTCYECLLRNYTTAYMHLQNGLRILARNHTTIHDGKIQQRRAAIPKDIIRALHRLDLQAMSLAEDSTPYPYNKIADKLGMSDLTISTQFSSLDDAMDHLITMFRWIFHIAGFSEPQPIPQDNLDTASSTLVEWKAKAQPFLDSEPPPSQSSHKNTILWLEMYYTLISIMIVTGVYGREASHDQHIQQYSHIVSIGESLLSIERSKLREHFFSFEIGIILPLYFTGAKCRDPQIRRQAISLLKHMKHQEGTWESSGAAQVAEFVVGVEEEGVGCCTNAQQIPENARVQFVTVKIDAEKREIDLSCAVCKDAKLGVWDMREGKKISFWLN